MSGVQEKQEHLDKLVAMAPYSLVPNQSRIVAMLAKSCHRPCFGTGIYGWQNNGMVAVLCSCVKKRASELEPMLETLEADLKQKLALAKGSESGESGAAQSEVRSGDVPGAPVQGNEDREVR